MECIVKGAAKLFAVDEFDMWSHLCNPINQLCIVHCIVQFLVRNILFIII